MKMSEIKVGRAYAYNPHSVKLANLDTVRVVVVAGPLKFSVSSYRGTISYKGYRVRLQDGKTTNVEPRRLLDTWAAYLEWRRSREEASKQRAARNKAHVALCKRLQIALRKISGVEVTVDTGWSSRGFEVHLFDQMGQEPEEIELADRAHKLVKAIEAVPF